MLEKSLNTLTPTAFTTAELSDKMVYADFDLIGSYTASPETNRTPTEQVSESETKSDTSENEVLSKLKMES